jgi:hypothetical protein
LGAGERCATGPNCCSGVCTVSPEGVARCQAAKGCRGIGERCEMTPECCAGSECRATLSGAKRCLKPGAACLGAGAACRVSDECCGQRCQPDGNGVLACRTACAPEGGSCVAATDCCGTRCSGAPGRGVCTSGGGVCVGPGGGCDPEAASCCAGSVCATLPEGGYVCAPVLD